MPLNMSSRAKKIIVTAALVVTGMGATAGWALSYQDEAPPAPPRPPWVNEDGTVDSSKIPSHMPAMDSNGNPLLDKNGNQVYIKMDRFGPPSNVGHAGSPDAGPGIGSESQEVRPGPIG